MIKEVKSRQHSVNNLIRLLSISFFLLSTINCYAQNKVIDSLFSVLKTAREDTNKVLLNISIAENFGYNFPDSMMAHAEQAKIISEKINYVKGLFLSYQTLASARYVTGEFAKGLNEAKQALKIAEVNKNKMWEALANNRIGLLYLQTGKYKDAIGYFENLVVTYKDSKNEKNLSKSYNNLSNCYLYLKDYPKSLELRKKAIDIRSRLNDQDGLAESYNDIGETYMYVDKNDSAIYYLDKCLRIKQEEGDDEMCSLSTLNLGMVYIKEKKYSKAKECLDKSYRWAVKINSMEYRLLILKSLSDIAHAENNSKLEAELLNHEITLKDSLLEDENRKQSNLLNAEFESEKKDKDIIRKDADIVKQHAESGRTATQRNAFIIGFVLVLLLAFFILRSLRQNKLTSEIIEEKNKELERLSIVASETENTILIMDANGKLEWVNESFVRLNGITLEKLKKLKGETIFEISNNPRIREIVEESIREKKSVVYESLNHTLHGTAVWESSTLTPIFDDNQNLKKLIIIDTDITESKLAEDIIREKNKDILASITYAKRIQQSMLPTEKYIEKNLKRLKKH